MKKLLLLVTLIFLVPFVHKSVWAVEILDLKTFELMAGYPHSPEEKFLGVNATVKPVFPTIGAGVKILRKNFTYPVKWDLVLGTTAKISVFDLEIEAEPEDSPPWIGRVDLGRLYQFPVMAWAELELPGVIHNIDLYSGLGFGYALLHVDDRSGVDFHLRNSRIFGAKAGFIYDMGNWSIGAEVEYDRGNSRITERNLPGVNRCKS